MSKMDYVTKQESERFNSCWEQKGECRLWKKFLDKDGYGSFYFRKKLRRAHRVAFYIKNGPIAEGMVIDHICRNRNCVEPTHLRMVTARQNSLENSLCISAVNRKKTTCKNGHPFDKIYTNSKNGKTQRICSVCDNAKRNRLRKKWAVEANAVKC